MQIPVVIQAFVTGVLIPHTVFYCDFPHAKPTFGWLICVCMYMCLIAFSVRFYSFVLCIGVSRHYMYNNSCGIISSTKQIVYKFRNYFSPQFSMPAIFHYAFSSSHEEPATMPNQYMTNSTSTQCANYYYNMTQQTMSN